MRLVYAAALGVSLANPAAVVVVEQPSPAIVGTWVGGLEAAGEFSFYSATVRDGATLTGTASLPMRGLSGAMRSVTVEGDRVRFEGPASLVLLGTVTGNTITGDFNAQAGRQKGTFRLTRVATVGADELLTYQGAYRFADGNMLLVERALFAPGLMVTDPSSGLTRIAFPRAADEFVTGPALLVPFPTEQTLTFTRTSGRVVSLTKTTGSGVSAVASRVPIVENDVEFRNASATLSGTLLLPASGGPHPALVFTHGGGAATREWFWGFGYLMAARGFVVLAFDKRGAGRSTGDWREASFEDLADDAVAGAALLQTRPDVDSARIGFWGLSQGAWIAPLAATRFGSAAFVVTLSGGGMSPDQGELVDTEWELRKAKLPDSEISEAIAFQTARNLFMRTGNGWDDYLARRTRATQPPARWYAFPGTDASGPSLPDSVEWTRMKRYYFYDPLPTLQRLRVPILSIFGALDSPKGVELNVTAMTSTLKAGGHRDFTIRVFDNGAHNLMDLSGAAPNEFARLSRFVPGLFDTMSSWLVERGRRK